MLQKNTVGGIQIGRGDQVPIEVGELIHEHLITVEQVVVEWETIYREIKTGVDSLEPNQDLDQGQVQELDQELVLEQDHEQVIRHQTGSWTIMEMIHPLEIVPTMKTQRSRTCIKNIPKLSTKSRKTE